MSINDARKFVLKLRENHKFRNKTLETSNPEDLSSFLHSEGMIFDQRELVEAMGECMEQLESQVSD